ncbi:MAG: tetratricopeptide repeat protein [Flavobacteriia bacterium]|jgi:tetratricopeptide (TPR) repeat protein
MLKYLVISLLFCSLFSCNNGSLRQQEDLGNKIFDLRQKKESLIKIDDFSGAIEICNEILQLNPKFDTMYVERATCYLHLYEDDTLNKEYLKLALNDMNKAISLKPNSNYYLARANLFRKYYKNSRQVLKNLKFALSSENAEEFRILEYRAEYYFKELKDSSNAFKDCKVLIEKYGDSAVTPYAIYAEYLSDCRRFNEAEEYYLKAIRSFEGNVNWNWYDYYCDLGYCRIELQDYYGALYCFERAGESRFSRLGNHELIGKGYCLYKLGQKELGRNMMNIFRRDWEYDAYGAPEIYFEIFPEKEPRRVKYKYDWPN